MAAVRLWSIFAIDDWVYSVPIGPIAAGVAANKFLTGTSDLTIAPWTYLANGNVTALTADTITGDSSNFWWAGRTRDTIVTSGQVHTLNFLSGANTTVAQFGINSGGNNWTGDINASTGAVTIATSGSIPAPVNVTSTAEAGKRRINLNWTPSVSGTVAFHFAIPPGGVGSIKGTDFWFGEASARP